MPMRLAPYPTRGEGCLRENDNEDWALVYLALNRRQNVARPHIIFIKPYIRACMAQCLHDSHAELVVLIIMTDEDLDGGHILSLARWNASHHNA